MPRIGFLIIAAGVLIPALGWRASTSQTSTSDLGIFALLCFPVVCIVYLFYAAVLWPRVLTPYRGLPSPQVPIAPATPKRSLALSY
jgi:hypothetical protein